MTQKTLLISKTLGIEGKKLLTPEDDFAALREFNHAYEGMRTAVEDMHLEYQVLLQADSELESRLKQLPVLLLAVGSEGPTAYAECSSAMRFQPSTRKPESLLRTRGSRAGTSTISPGT